MLGFHAPVEEIFASDPRLDAAGFQARTRRKSHLLLADLRALEGPLSTLLRCEAMPATPTLSHALGVAYVLEGSTLGGKYILSRLPVALAPLRGTATAFLECYRAETGPRWRAFGAIVEAEVRDPDSLHHAIAGARDTFTLLIDWLARFEQRDERRERQAS